MTRKNRYQRFWAYESRMSLFGTLMFGCAEFVCLNHRWLNAAAICLALFIVFLLLLAPFLSLNLSDQSEIMDFEDDPAMYKPLETEEEERKYELLKKRMKIWSLSVGFFFLIFGIAGVFLLNVWIIALSALIVWLSYLLFETTLQDQDVLSKVYRYEILAGLGAIGIIVGFVVGVYGIFTLNLNTIIRGFITAVIGGCLLAWNIPPGNGGGFLD